MIFIKVINLHYNVVLDFAKLNSTSKILRYRARCGPIFESLESDLLLRSNKNLGSRLMELLTVWGEIFT